MSRSRPRGLPAASRVPGRGHSLARLLSHSAMETPLLERRLRPPDPSQQSWTFRDMEWRLVGLFNRLNYPFTHWLSFPFSRFYLFYLENERIGWFLRYSSLCFN